MSPTLTAELGGRRAAALLGLPSVRRMVELLETRCREPSWARIAIATLERFRDTTDSELESLLDSALVDPSVAQRSLQRYATLISNHGPAHAAALAFGAKIWYRANDVAVPWRPLRATGIDRPMLHSEPDHGTRLLLLVMIGSGLGIDEAMSIRIGDVGSLDASGKVIPDVFAEPLAAAYRPDDGGPERVTFLSYAAQSVWLTESRGHPDTRMDAAQPFVTDLVGRQTRSELAARANTRHAALIAAGNNVNVATCQLTGDFFREWGMPGARYEQRQRSV